MDRRTLLQLLLNAGGVLVAAIVAIPSLLAVLSPVWRRRRQQQWSVLGPLDEFPVDQVQEVPVEVPREDWGRALREKGVYVWRRTDEQVVVFSRNCTDLSCPVAWDAGSQCFYCPCHGGIFAKNGDRMAGPPKRPLYRYATRIRNGVIEIDLRSLPPMT